MMDNRNIQKRIIIGASIIACFLGLVLLGYRFILNLNQYGGDSVEEATPHSFPKLEIEVKNYDVKIVEGQVEYTENPNPEFEPVKVLYKSESELLFLADEQNLLIDLSDPFLIALIEEGAGYADDSSKLYNFSKENFSALNIESFDYSRKMSETDAENPISLSELARANVGYCFEQSIFRGLAYAYAGDPKKIVVMYPPQDSVGQYGHATVKGLQQDPKEVIEDFLATDLYTWDVRYYQEIQINIANTK
ncbi:hypothetical protein GF357_00025 [Candidatus Dojkabacteria bacterium]|nr:hypothetical protein [Candidatus Dojkabacteria bacterium]